MPDYIEGCFANRLRVNRSVLYNEQIIAVTNVNQVAYPANPRRVRFGICGTTANRITIRFGQPAVDGLGFVSVVAAPNQVLRIEELGIMITQPINMILSVAGPQNAYTWEEILNDT